jgi:transcriptional regulator with XRE-family HTH domain
MPAQSPMKPRPHFLLKAKMAAKGMTVAKLASKAGMSESVVSQILNGHWVQPERLQTLSRLIEAAPGLRIIAAK